MVGMAHPTPERWARAHPRTATPGSDGGPCPPSDCGSRYRSARDDPRHRHAGSVGWAVPTIRLRIAPAPLRPYSGSGEP